MAISAVFLQHLFKQRSFCLSGYLGAQKVSGLLKITNIIIVVLIVDKFGVIFLTPVKITPKKIKL